LKTKAPRIPVSDGVGVVADVGDRVTRFRAGDRVAGIFNPNWLDGACTPEKVAGALGSAEVDGVMAEYRVFDEQTVVAVPGHLSDAEAAALPDSGVTAWHAVRLRGHVQPGDLVLIQGTGGVSLFALQFAKRAGAIVVLISSDDGKLDRARASTPSRRAPRFPTTAEPPS